MGNRENKINFISNGMKNRIMRKIYLIWFFRKITSPFALEAGVFLALSLLLTAYVSLVDVWNNSSAMIFSPSDFSNYIFSSFAATDIITQILLLGMLAAMALLLGNTFKTAFRRIPLRFS